MSIASQINAIASSRDTIRQKMISAGQATSSDKLSTLASNLSIGTDTTDATATSDDIISGKTAYVNGVKVTGNMAFATDSDIREIIFNR